MNGIEAPSMFPQTSAVRRAKKGMADSRAMAEQMERYNPVNPKKELMVGYTGMGHCVGGSATPSMGLSEYRGGKKHTLLDHLENPKKGYGKKKPSEAHMMGQHLAKHIGDLHGAGFFNDFADGFKQGFTGTLDVLKPATAFIPGFNQTMDTVRGVAGMGVSEEQRAMEQMSKKRLGRSRNKSDIALRSGNVDGVRGGRREQSAEEERMAEELYQRQKRNTDAGRHPNDRGDGYFGLTPEEAHAKKQAEITAQGERERPIVSAIGKYGMRGVNALTDLAVEHGSKVAPQQLVDFIKKSRDVGRKGRGKKCGGANTGRYEGHGNLMEGGMLGQDGHGQRKKRMVGAGVSARASLVKKVMAEKGLNMIQASKYVKEHNLYHK